MSWANEEGLLSESSDGLQRALDKLNDYSFKCGGGGASK